MADRSSSVACKKFAANVFDKNKCQNCFKPREAHHEPSSPTSSPPTRPTTLDVAPNRHKTTVKSGTLALATQVSTLPEIKVQKWEKVWFMLYSSGDLEWFPNESGKPTQVSSGIINMDDCSGLTNAEVDTNEPFTIGIKTLLKVHYLKAENRLEMDNWCRVLKPFVIASPGYNFSRKSANARSLNYHETKFNSSTKASKQEPKTTLSRTISAPWKSTDTTSSSPSKKRWSATEMSLLKEEDSRTNTKGAKKTAHETGGESRKQKETAAAVELDPKPQPNYSDMYLRPATPEPKVNGEACLADSDEIPNLERQLADAQRQAKHSQGRAEICSKNLAETKKSLEKANNVVSIQKANIESLTSELESLKARLKNSDEKMEKRLRDLETGFSSYNGAARPGSIEAGFIQIQSKLQENEKALIRRTRELEKANESRAKVAKHTRSLLIELEGKLNENNRRINELEEQLLNRTVELQCEKEERERVETEKGRLVRELNASREQTKQKEISQKSTELLRQAKQDHFYLKSGQKHQLQYPEEIEHFRSELHRKVSEIERLRERLRDVDKKDGEIRLLEVAYKKANEDLGALRSKFGVASEELAKEKARCVELETKLDDVEDEVKKKEKDLEESGREKGRLESEMERVRREHDSQVALLQKECEKTKNCLLEVEQQLNSLHTETDGRHNSEMDELRDSLEEWKSRLRSSEKECEKLRNVNVETLEIYNNEKNRRLKLERDLENALNDLDESKKLSNEVAIVRERLKKTEEDLEHKKWRVSELDELKKATEENACKTEHERVKRINELGMKLKGSETELRELKQKLCESDEKVVSLAEELTARLKMEQEALSWVERVEKNLTETQKNLSDSREGILLKAEELDQEKASVVEVVKRMSDCIKGLERSLEAEGSKAAALEVKLNENSEDREAKCALCDKTRAENSNLVGELEQVRQSHREELEKLKESTASESKTLKCHAEEIRLKLTSKVILLQSDISELNAKHSQELLRARELHRQELEALHDKCDSLGASDEIVRLRKRLGELESELQLERVENTRRIEALKSDCETKKAEGGQQNGLISIEKLDEVRERHSKEIETLKENHQKELEENKSDMMMVLQALKSDTYQSNSRSNDSVEANEELQKLEHYVETLKKDHEREIDRLNEEHEQDLQQLRSDMVTLLRAQESYKSSPVDEGEGVTDSGVADLHGQVEEMKRSHEQEILEKDERHRAEVEQLKSDMLVAIQAASAVGNVTPQEVIPPRTMESNDAKVSELNKRIATMQKAFDEERETLQNAVKKAESATKFGLRRNEEMSNKIYQMQREMEEIDSKYQKEIKLYKEAFDQEKHRKTTIGAVPGILAENESLKVKLREVELNMEQMQVRYDGEIKRYKEKFQQENVLTVEELQLKIKSLEDTIEQMRLEHENELERYTKAVKRGKVSLAGTAKERDLERKIDDLESKVDVMRQKHREEIRKYRERLEDEMERHRKEASESRTKIHRLETDARQMEGLRNKVTELENKTSKLSKEANKYKEQEAELTETKTKNRELQRQVDSLKRKLDKLNETNEESKERETRTSDDTTTSARNKLSRYSSCDNVTLNSLPRNKSQVNSTAGANDSPGNQDDVFELNNNLSMKSEIAGYKLNHGVTKRPASVSAFPVQSENGSRRTSYNEKRRDGGNASNRPYQSSYLRSSNSSSSLK